MNEPDYKALYEVTFVQLAKALQHIEWMRQSVLDAAASKRDAERLADGMEERIMHALTSERRETQKERDAYMVQLISEAVIKGASIPRKMFTL